MYYSIIFVNKVLDNAQPPPSHHQHLEITLTTRLSNRLRMGDKTHSEWEIKLTQNVRLCCARHAAGGC